MLEKEKYKNRYTIFTEFKYYRAQRAPSQGYNFDIAILRDWEPRKEQKFPGTITGGAKALEYRYGTVVGLIEIKLAGSLNRLWGKPGKNCRGSVTPQARASDIMKFKKLWIHPSLLRGVERAYLCLFEKNQEKKLVIKDAKRNEKDVPENKILMITIPCHLEA